MADDSANLLSDVDWLPSPHVIENANVTSLIRELALKDYPALHRWSVEHRDKYWAKAIDSLCIRFQTPPRQIIDDLRSIHPRWLIGAKMNIVESCFQADPNAPAIIESDGTHTRRYAYADLQNLTTRVATGLPLRGIKNGDAVGIILPMTARCVAIYLGIIAAGAVAVGIPDSFAPDQIAARLRLARAKLVFTQDIVAWGEKRLPLYEKIATPDTPPIVVLSLGESSQAKLRERDIAFNEFLTKDTSQACVTRDPGDAITLLFSSGTTGDPKAIPWDHTTPIKAAADAHFHQDVHAGDVLCWPTSLGWMMGPWLIFSALLNRSAMALWAQSPTDRRFGQFIQDAGVTMLGTVPSLVRAWRQTNCMADFDWSNIRVLSSTGECSNPDDVRFLMQGAGNKPMIEYCGGTEIGGGYITGTVVQPCFASTFTTPALGLDFVLLDDDRHSATKGEVFIEGPSIGLSTRLLNRDHDAIYYADAPIAKSGMQLRRHGDELEHLPNGYWRVAGRSDDTMNLGGIKVGCAEIERVLNPLPGVQETAAVAAPPAGGGPSRLVIFVVPSIDVSTTPLEFQQTFQQAIRTHLNPLFHIDHVRIVSTLPRTASNKVMRRELRAEVIHQDSEKAGGTTYVPPTPPGRSAKKRTP